jgi:hypothetical protein
MYFVAAIREVVEMIASVIELRRWMTASASAFLPSLKSFLASIYSTSAYSHSVPPALLTESGVEITPKSVNWHFKKSTGILQIVTIL